MKEADIVVIRTTGEKVYLLGETDRGTWKVRRANVSDSGTIEHVVDEFFAGELATLEQFADQQVSEMIIKATAQKRLYKAETQIARDAETEVMEAPPKPILLPS